MSNDTFIPRNGIPLFFPQDESCGFQASSGGLSRRKFLKRTGGATAAAFLAAIPMRSEAQESPESANIIKTTEWRLKCTHAPNPNDGTVTWYEVPALGAPGQPGFAKLDCSGPQPNDTGTWLYPVRAEITSSVGDGGVESSEAQLQYPNGTLYGGTEIKDDSNDPRPSLKYLHFGNGAVSPFLNLAVVGQEATGSVTYSGYKFDQMTVSAGNTVNNKKKYTDGSDETYNSKEGAVTGLEGNYDGQAGSSTEFVGTNHKWSVKAEHTASHSGELNKSETYARTVASDGTVTWQANGVITSSIAGSMASEWTVVVQTKKRTHTWENGVRKSTVVTKDWEDPESQ